MLYVRFALDEECAVETEGMWAELTNAGELVLRSIPVFTPGVAFGDAISIEEANDCLWAVDGVRDGNQATLWIQSDLANPSRALEALEQIAEHFETMGDDRALRGSDASRG